MHRWISSKYLLSSSWGNLECGIKKRFTGLAGKCIHKVREAIAMSDRAFHLFYIIFLTVLALGSVGGVAWWLRSVGRQEKEKN
jgi:hypothetical protein